MNRLTEAWFEFRGISSQDMGVMMQSMPTRGIPVRNLARSRVAGRSGRLRQSDKSYDDISVKLEFDARDETKIPMIDAWLTGSGLLWLSDEPERAYMASIEREPQRKPIRPRFGGQRYSVTFVCEPFKQWYQPGAENPYSELLYTSPGNIVNPGTAPCLPEIKIEGQGDFYMSISLTRPMEGWDVTGLDFSTLMHFNGIEDGIIIDSELGDALTLDRGSLANDKISGTELFVIYPGTSYLNWTVLSAGSVINQVTITPRWRWF